MRTCVEITILRSRKTSVFPRRNLISRESFSRQSYRMRALVKGHVLIPCPSLAALNKSVHSNAHHKHTHTQREWVREEKGLYRSGSRDISDIRCTAQKIYKPSTNTKIPHWYEFAIWGKKMWDIVCGMVFMNHVQLITLIRYSIIKRCMCRPVTQLSSTSSGHCTFAPRKDFIQRLVSLKSMNYVYRGNQLARTPTEHRNCTW